MKRPNYNFQLSVLTFIFSLLLTMFSGPVLKAKEPYSGGAGTTDDPYLIDTAADLLELGDHSEDYDAYFLLTSDIDLSSAGVFTTAVIANDTDGFDFTGVFNGNGHTINNLTINAGSTGNNKLGLFGSIDGGTIKNLLVLNVSITSGNGSIQLGGLAGFNNGNIYFSIFKHIKN